LAYDTKAYKYDIASDTWSAIASLPGNRALPSVQAANGKIYIIGGYSATSPFTSQSTCYEYDPTANTYTAKAKVPTAVFGAGSFVYNNRIYLLGGGTTAFATSVTTIQIFDPVANTWVTSPSTLPVGLWQHGVTVAGDSVMVIGGVTYPAGSFTGSVYIGGISGNNITFTKAADYPDGPIYRLCGGNDGAKGYFNGGIDNTTNSSGSPAPNTYSYNPLTKTWTTFDPKPTPVYFGSQMIFANGKLYILGGQDTPNTATAVCEVLDPAGQSVPLAVLSSNSIDKWVKKSTPAVVPLTLQNKGGQPLTWSTQVDANSTNWLSVQPPSGTTASLGADLINVNLNATGLAVGDYSGAITLTTNDQANPSFTINVTIHVQNEDVDTDLSVYVEEFTGTWCGYCPYGVDSLHSLIQQFGSKVNIVSIHENDAMVTKSSDSIMTKLSVNSFPSAAINRVQFPGQATVWLGRGDWGNAVRSLLDNRRSPLTITVTNKKYIKMSKQFTMDVNLFAHQTIPGPLYMAIIETEDSINYTQEKYLPAVTYLTPFYHENVFKKIVPSVTGDLLTGINIPTQTSINRTYSFTSLDSIPAHANIVVLVYNATPPTLGEVLQSYKEPLLVNATGIERAEPVTNFALSQNYPNPFNPSTTIDYAVPANAHVSIIVTDIYGRCVRTLVNGQVEAGNHSATFDAGDLGSGQYFVTLRSGAFMQTRTVTLMK
jgi:thiol-disulfide isomerase/thioredoxin